MTLKQSGNIAEQLHPSHHPDDWKQQVSDITNFVEGLSLDSLPPSMSKEEFENCELGTFRNMVPQVKSSCCRAPVSCGGMSGEHVVGGPRRLQLVCQTCSKERSFVRCLNKEGHKEVLKSMSLALQTVIKDSVVDFELFSDAMDGLSKAETKDALDGYSFVEEGGESEKLWSLKKLSPAQFEQLEREVYKETKSLIKCSKITCISKMSKLSSAGGGGNVNAQGVRRLDVKCSCCLQKSRFHLKMKEVPGLTAQHKLLTQTLAKVDKNLESGKDKNEVEEESVEIFTPHDTNGLVLN